MQLSFSTGAFWGERTDTTGSGIGPRQFGIVQGVMIDFAFTDKPLFGQLQWPVAIGRGQGKITGKCESAQLNMLLYADIFFGLTPATGQVGVAQAEAATVNNASPPTVTVANSATYLDDLGVAYAAGIAAGDRFNRVSPGPPSLAATYSVNLSTGVYTFAPADVGKSVIVSYKYNIAGSGEQLLITAQVQGFTPSWKGTFYQKISPGPPGTGGSLQGFAILLNAVTSSKLTFSTKQQDWQIPGFDFEAFADAAGNIGTISLVSQ
jgi:hypothetical protein